MTITKPEIPRANDMHEDHMASMAIMSNFIRKDSNER